MFESLSTHEFDVGPGDGKDGRRAPRSRGNCSKTLVGLIPRKWSDWVRGQVGGKVRFTVGGRESKSSFIKAKGYGVKLLTK